MQKVCVCTMDFMSADKNTSSSSRTMLCALTKKQSAAIENSEVGSESESDSTIANNCQGEFD